jgi:hypothetical protein
MRTAAIVGLGLARAPTATALLGLARAAIATVLLGMLLAARPGGARAAVQATVTIDGPSPEIVGFGGVAMASDGTGGAVYLKRVGGVAHVFVARFTKGKWLAPVEVDDEDPYPASAPRIGAADAGELLVVWATPFASENEKPVYRLESSLLAPGSPAFGPAVTVDRNVGQDGETSPNLAMSSNGQADVVYRVLKQTQGERQSIPLLRPGDVAEEVRVARFIGEHWVDLGEVNHDPGLSMRAPSAANAPQIAIDGGGNGIVVWQEPEIDGVAMIWARRLFGSSIDYAMPVSATSFDGSPFTDDADSPSVAFSRLGQTDVAYRQLSEPGSPLAGPRIFLNVLPDGESVSGAAFLGAQPIDPQVALAGASAIGRPSIDIDEAREARLLFDENGTPRVVEVSDLGALDALSLGPPFAGSQLVPANELTPASVMNPAGGGISAWPSADPHGNPAVAVMENFPDGAVQSALVSGSSGGPIGELGVGRSGLGDGLVAFEQGPVGAAAIVGMHAGAPPTTFAISVPRGWIKPSQASVEWTTASSANGPLTYTVILDGHPLMTPVGAQSMPLAPRQLPNGVHKVRMLVSDADGESTLTAPVRLLIGSPPPSRCAHKVTAAKRHACAGR